MSKFPARMAAATLALAIGSGAAAAADLRTAPPPTAPVASYPESIVSYGFNWTGAYVGVNVGGRSVGLSGGRGAGNLDTTALAGGLQAGYLFQSGGLVYGVEADLTYGNNEKSRGVPGGRAGAALDWSGSARARVGWAFDRVLVYGTGGITAADFEAFGHGNGRNSSKSETAVGWTAGGGLEYALTKSVSLRGEYLYSDYGQQTLSYPGTGIASSKSDVTSHLGRIGVNFKF